MPDRSTQLADLRRRREALGLSESDMAAGIALRTAEIRDIEAGAASDAMLNHYAGWLSRIEGWSIEELAHQKAAAQRGGRFWLKGEN